MTHSFLLAGRGVDGKSEEAAVMGFSDQPVRREVVDVNANGMKTKFEELGGERNPLDDAQFFVTQHYLDFLGRGADAEGSAYWTGRIRQCGGDRECEHQRRIDVKFVLMQYFGYLRREPDAEGYSFWLNVLNQREPGNYRGMVCSFLTSREYQERFSKVVTRSNADCGK